MRRLTAALRRARRHWREWRAVLKEEGLRANWRKMLRALFSGRVDARTWRRRARVCPKCPLFDRELRRCRGPWIKGNPTGCGCYVPWLLHTRAPYPKGCWGRQFVRDDFGWR